MIPEILNQIKLLEKEELTKEQAINIILINELKEIKEVLKDGREIRFRK